MNPALIGKLAFDKQINDQFRLRVSGSGYYTAGSYKNTLLVETVPVQTTTSNVSCCSWYVSLYKRTFQSGFGDKVQP